MATFKETYARMTRVNNSKQMRVINFTLGLALTGLLVKRFRDKPSVWNALPLARATISLAETFKPFDVDKQPDPA